MKRQELRGEMAYRFHEVTEGPGQMATHEQLARLYQRYRFASEFVTDRRVLEVGCGRGLGLGYLSTFALEVMGGDIDESNVEAAARYYSGRNKVTVLNLDAHNLPFEDDYFDVVLLFEAIYYLEKPEMFIAEAHRVLKQDGLLIICTVNKSWKNFHPSKYSYEYFSALELVELLRKCFARVELYGAFREVEGGASFAIFSVIKRTASKLRLIPGSLKAREFLKRLFIGRLEPIPNEVSDRIADYHKPLLLRNDQAFESYKILYAVATNEID